MTMDSGDIGYRFECKSDSSKYITRSSIDESTSNLNCHVQLCDSTSSSSSSLTPLSTYDVGNFQYLVAAWSAQHAQPHSIIEDEELHKILTMLYPAIKIHSHQMVSRDISDMYHHSRTAIALHLQSIKQCLHLMLDGWTAPNVFSFLGVMVQYFEKGTICSLVLDFVKYEQDFHFVIQSLTRHCT